MGKHFPWGSLFVTVHVTKDIGLWGGAPVPRGAALHRVPSLTEQPWVQSPTRPPNPSPPLPRGSPRLVSSLILPRPQHTGPGARAEAEGLCLHCPRRSSASAGETLHPSLAWCVRHPWCGEQDSGLWVWWGLAPWLAEQHGTGAQSSRVAAVSGEPVGTRPEKLGRRWAGPRDVAQLQDDLGTESPGARSSPSDHEDLAVSVPRIFVQVS